MNRRWNNRIRPAPGRVAYRWALILILFLGDGGAPFALARTPDQANEYAVKSAFLYNFAVYVEWPASRFPAKDSPIVICVYGRDPFGSILERTVGGKTAQGRPIVVRKVRTLDELKGAHIVFVPDAESGSVSDVTGALKDQGTLVVGETTGLARKGAAFNFYLDKRRVRLEVNTNEVKRAGLKVGSKLLRIARQVEE